MKKMLLRLDPALHARTVEAATKEGLTTSEFVRRAIEARVVVVPSTVHAPAPVVVPSRQGGQQDALVAKLAVRARAWGAKHGKVGEGLYEWPCWEDVPLKLETPLRVALGLLVLGSPPSRAAEVQAEPGRDEGYLATSSEQDEP